MCGCRSVLRVSACVVAGALLFAPGRGVAGAARVVINEVMFRPATGGSEWIELWNVSAEAVSLQGWALADSRRVPSALASTPHLLEPDGYRVLVADQAAFFRQYPRVEPHLVRELEGSWPVLNNTQSEDSPYADKVILTDAAGFAVDSLAYGEDWGIAGSSLERLSPDAGPHAGNWCASLTPEGATPGGKNSVYLEGVPRFPLVAEPNPFLPERHGVTFVSFRIPLLQPSIRAQVFDSTGRLVRTLLDDRAAGRSGRLAWDGRDDTREEVPTGVYILYLQAVDGSAGESFEAKGTVVVARGF